MKFSDCFLFFWAIFALLNPDPDCKSGSRDPIVSGSKFWSVSTTLRIIVKNLIRIRINVKIQKLQRLKTEPSWTLTMEAWRLKMEPWKVRRPLVGDSRHFDEEQYPDPDPHLTEKL
jgi:hypothetical protein